VLVHVIDVIITWVLVVDIIIQKLLILLRDANTQFVLLVFTVATQESVLVVKDVHLM
jgi:hypothetical protein